MNIAKALYNAISTICYVLVGILHILALPFVLVSDWCEDKEREIMVKEYRERGE